MKIALLPYYRQTVASSIDLLSGYESFSSPKRRVWILRESFSSKIRLPISDFARESQSLTNKSEYSEEKVVHSTTFPQLHEGFITY